MKLSVRHILPLWQKMKKYTLGRWLFSRSLGFINPYSGNLGADIKVYEKGYAQLLLKDRRKNRNHLDSVHAIALANLGELTSGLAVLGSLRQGERGIVIHLSVDYYKKARGELKALCRCELPEISEGCEKEVFTEIFDSEETLVCKVRVLWKLGREG